MAKQPIFISSVQIEFAHERQAIYDYLLADPLLGRFFEPFLFERLPATDQRADTVYLNEVARSSIYLGILGKKYGFRDSEGVSPTEREFDKATELHKTRLVFLSDHSTSEREGEQNDFIEKAQSVLVRKRFANIEELKSAVYAALVHYLIEKEIIRVAPFDASLNAYASLDDIDEGKVRDFISVARFKRGFPFEENTAIMDVFAHLNLVQDGRLTNAALLLFGKSPQRFFINSEIRCAHFHGTIVEKPIPSYQVFKGDVFELIDQAVDFVLSKIDYSIGSRVEEISIPGKYEIPKEVISEAIVNAVAHRDYTLNGSVQVMLFRDRLEVINPGMLPFGWTIEKLKRPHTSVPFNPLLAEPMYLKGYIERLGTGTVDMVRLARKSQLKEPVFLQTEEFKTVIYRPDIDQVSLGYPLSTSQEPFEYYGSTPQVPHKYPTSTPQVPHKYGSASIGVFNILKVLFFNGEQGRKTIQEELGLKDVNHFRANYIDPALVEGLIRMKYPDSPNHPRQKYLITEKGKELLKQK